MTPTTLVGNRYGKLTVLSKYGYHISKNGTKKVTWLCQCDCGNQRIVTGNKLKEGRAKSCGCIRPYCKFNEYREDGNNIYIKVNDSEVIIDREDFFKIYPKRVSLSPKGYAICGVHKRVHRLIMDCPAGLQVDHINRNKLDNRKCNLRIVSGFENQMNRPIMSNTGEFGISLYKDGYYHIVIDGRNIGKTKTLEEAITIRNSGLVGTRQLKSNPLLHNLGIE